MIKRFIGWFVLVPISAVLIVFALANRHLVNIRFDPLSPDNPLIPGLDIPLFIVIFAMLMLGVLLGGAAVWFTQGKKRRETRKAQKKIKLLEKELLEVKRAVRQRTNDQKMLSPEDLLGDG